jgi:hypothetical protein
MADAVSKGRRQGVTRRGVVAAAGLVVGTAAAQAGPGLPADARHEAEPEDDDPRVLRYRETDHIRWFYRRARM